MGSLFSFVTYPMELGVVWLAVAVGSAGIGIILFTIGVRLILAPLQIVQLRSAKAMQRLQPHLQELRQKHGKDRQALSEATMALYKEHQVNPAMGCLPTLLQFPILIGLFYALLHLGSSPTGYPHAVDWAKSACNGHVFKGPGDHWAQWLQYCYAVHHASGSTKHIFDLFHANFLWLSNGLGGRDPYYLLPLLAGATQWVQSRMMLTRSTDPQQQMMNSMMNFMPLMIIFFAVRYPSGLALYWVTSTLIGILIQYRITGWGLLPRPSQLLNRSTPSRASVRAAQSNTRRPSRPVPAPEADLNGQDGAGDEPNTMTTVTRPRKKANRARGGRGGGRRG